MSEFPKSGAKVQEQHIEKVSELSASRALLTTQQWSSLDRPSDIEGNIALYKELAWINAPVKAIAQVIADLDLRLFKVKNEGSKKTEFEEVDNHPILDLLYYPNLDRTKDQMLYEAMVYFITAGRAYWEVVHNTVGKIKRIPSELWTIRPDRLKPVPDKNGHGIEKWIYQVKSYAKKKELRPDQVIPFINFDPLDDYGGMGMFEPAGEEIVLERNMLKYIASFFHKGTVDGILSTDKNLLPTDVMQITNQLNQRRQQDPRSIMILGKGLKYQDMAKSPTEADFKDGRKDNRKTFLSVAGVPQGRVGLIEDIKYDNYALQEQAFNINTIIPLAGSLAAGLTLHLIPQYADLARNTSKKTRYVLAFDVEDLMKEDSDRLTTRLTKEIGSGIKTPNEARAEMDLEAYAGGNLFVLGKNLVPVGMSKDAGSEEKAALDAQNKPPEPKIIPGTLEEQEEQDRDEVLEKIDRLQDSIEEAVESLKAQIVEEVLEKIKSS